MQEAQFNGEGRKAKAETRKAKTLTEGKQDNEGRPSACNENLRFS
jgi:hypothetical protein